jgi:hypothetical protein
MDNEFEYLETKDYLDEETQDSFDVWKLKKEYLFWGICILTLFLALILT